jgi:hypothetical protein
VVSLSRWSQPPKTSHAARALACLVLLLGEGDETTLSNSVGPLIESARALGLEDELER